MKARRLSHLNAIIFDFDACIRDLTRHFGANLILDMPYPDWHAALLEIGGVIIEVFEPPNMLLHARHGPHYFGVEYEADLREARAAVVDNGVGIIREADTHFHTDPADCFGVAYELYPDTFFGPDIPYLTSHTRPMEYWRNDHPAGFTGPVGYTQLTSDIAATARLLMGLFGAELVYKETRPNLDAKAIGLRIADDIVDLIEPTGDGKARRELERLGQGIHATVLGVTDIDQARDFIAGNGLPIVEGFCRGSIAVDPAALQGIRFEFLQRD